MAASAERGVLGVRFLLAKEQYCAERIKPSPVQALDSIIHMSQIQETVSQETQEDVKLQHENPKSKI